MSARRDAGRARRLSRPTVVRLGLSLLSGAMLGCAFPPVPTGALALVGLVPLLIVLADVRTIRAGLGYTYLSMLLFHAITISWTGGYSHGNDPYMMIAGTVTILVHPLFYFLPVSAYLWTRRHLGELAALAALPFFWVAYEYSHTLSEWSFPWLTLGNTQTYDLARIQFIEYTGVLGLSFWILLINCLAFALYSSVARRGLTGNRTAASLVAGILLLFMLPWLHGWLRGPSLPPEGEGESTTSVVVGIIQSNADPWEKWRKPGYQVVRDYLGRTAALLERTGAERPQIVLWPETAIPFYLLSERQAMLYGEFRAGLDTLPSSILTGVPHAVLYEDSTQAPPSARRLSDGRRYDAFNSAVLFQPGSPDYQWYGKMKMVPFAERVPYADAMMFADFLRWDVGIGAWQIGRDTTVFHDRSTGARFATVICYESTYPDFVASFVRKGAEFLAIITIDSWWGRMPGAFQHRQFAVLRAVENRRWIARCAVGGFSCFIDPEGRIHDMTELFTEASIARRIGRSDAWTFYTRHGEWLGIFSAWMAGAFLAAVLGQKFLRKKREDAWNED
jgi:apolipoprotein N-acyltransferase